MHTPDDYEQTGKQAAVRGRDIRWLGDTSDVIAHARRHGYIPTLHWHAFLGGESARKNEREHPVDLGAVHSIERVNLLWGGTIHAADYSVDIARENPADPRSWTTVYSEKDHPYGTREATYRIRFPATPARYVRVHATRRAGRRTWGGYQLTALEGPVDPGQRR